MEIKNVLKNVENEYPRMKQINKKYLLNNIPNKWLKIGLSSLGLTMIMKNNAFAKANSNTLTYMLDIAGGAPAKVETPIHVEICNTTSQILYVVSAIIFIITGLNILITKIHSKKQSEPKKVKKWIIAMFIISIIAFVSSILIKVIVCNGN